MRVLVCGGRDYNNKSYIFGTLDAIHALNPITWIIHGDCPTEINADKLAEEWANTRRVYVKRFPADWKNLGKKAGPVRNKQMATEGKPHLVVAFPGGRGTAHMISLIDPRKVVDLRNGEPKVEQPSYVERIGL